MVLKLYLPPGSGRTRWLVPTWQAPLQSGTKDPSTTLEGCGTILLMVEIRTAALGAERGRTGFRRQKVGANERGPKR